MAIHLSVVKRGPGRPPKGLRTMTPVERGAAFRKRRREAAIEWDRWSWIKQDARDLVRALERQDTKMIADVLCCIAMRIKRDGLL